MQAIFTCPGTGPAGAVAGWFAGPGGGATQGGGASAPGGTAGTPTTPNP